MAKPTRSGRVVNAGPFLELRRRAGQVARSPEVQQRAQEVLPAARRLFDAVRREWAR